MTSLEFALTERSAWRIAAYVRSLSRVAGAANSGGRDTRGGALRLSAAAPRAMSLAGQGRMLGPELTSIGELRGAAHLRESIVNPAATHPPGYLVVRQESAGRDVRGIRIGEDVFWIHIRDASGTVHVLNKQELAGLDRDLRGTLMPSYESRLSTTELDDLVAYLARLRLRPNEAPPR